jgi:integrase
VIDYFDYLNQKDDLCLATKINKWNYFRSFLQFCMEYYDLVIVIPKYCVHWKPIHKQPNSNKDVVMTKEEVKRILSHNFHYNYYYYIILRLFAETGMRIGEFLSINVQDVHTEKRYVETQGKTGRKVYYYYKGLAKHLTIYLKEREMKECPCKALFLSTLRSRYARRSINKYIQNCVKRLGIDKWISSHTFRRTLNTLRKRMGCSNENRRILLNHAVSDVNYACYVKLNYDDYIKLYDTWNPYKNILK